MRIDKYLWCVRLYKTRSLAQEAIGRGRVQMGGRAVKASREVNEGDEFTVRRPSLTLTFRVVGLPRSRVGAPLVGDYLEDLTPASEYDRIKPSAVGINFERASGAGRPTKRERRQLDSLQDQMYTGWAEWDEELLDELQDDEGEEA